MILSNALLVLGLSGPDLVLVSGRQGGRVGSRFGAAIEDSRPLGRRSHYTRGYRAITGRVRHRRPLCRPRLATSPKMIRSRLRRPDDRMKDRPLRQAGIEQGCATLGAWPEE